MQEGKLKMVTNFQYLNNNLKQPVWPFASTEKIRRSLNSKDKVFAKVDLASGYHQIPIQEADRDLTCFLLPWGKYRYWVLPMGLSPSGDVFCHRTDKAIMDLDGILKLVDDCLTGGRGVSELGKRLRKLLTRCREHNIKIYPRRNSSWAAPSPLAASSLMLHQESFRLAQTQPE